MARNQEAYFHDSELGYKNPDWMSKISGERKLSELSIPGTHDSVALFWWSKVETQSMSLITQLNSGIRFIDIGCAYKGENDLQVYREECYQNINLEIVIETVSQFLKENPTETVLMKIRQEHSNVSNLKFHRSFLNYVSRYSDLFWNTKKCSCKNPQLDEIRGKIVVIYDAEGCSFGIPYKNIIKNEECILTKKLDLYNKWKSVKAFIPKVEENINDNKLYLTDLSAKGCLPPYFVASGNITSDTNSDRLDTGLKTLGNYKYYPDFPRESISGIVSNILFEGINILTQNFIDMKHYQRVGIIIADFPGKGLIDSIIKTNYPKYFDIKVNDENNMEFSNIEFDLNKKILGIKNNKGKTTTANTESYLKIEVYDEDYDSIYSKDFLGNTIYNKTNVEIDIKESFRVKLTLKDNFQINYGDNFGERIHAIKEKSINFIVTEYGVKEANPNNNIVRFFGFADREYAALILDFDLNKLILKTKAGQPHEYFSNAYTRISIWDDENKTVFVKEYIGNREYKDETNIIDIKTGYTIRLSSQEPERVKFDKKVDDKFSALQYNDNIFKVTEDGLTDPSKEYTNFRFLGLLNREFASAKIYWDLSEIYLTTIAGQPHNGFAGSYVKFEIINKSDEVIFTKDYIGGTSYSYDYAVIKIEEGYKIKIRCEEPSRVRLIKVKGGAEESLSSKENTFIILKNAIEKVN